MDEHHLVADVLVNRDEPIPIINIPAVSEASSDAEGRSSKIKKSFPGSKLKDRIQHAAASAAGFGHGGDTIQDKLMAKWRAKRRRVRILQQVLPPEEEIDDAGSVDPRLSKNLSRPNFNIALMSTNFNRFNARIGVAFVFQNRVIRLMTWRTPSHTLSFALTYTFICLNPYLLPLIPITLALFFLFVPAYLSRHPPPPSPMLHHKASTYSISGPPLAPARTIKPVSNISKDFFRNMRDLQNSMDDFSTVHDAIIATITPVTNFSNEPLSSTLFVFLFATACLLFLTSHLLPWTFIALLGGWTALAGGHPAVQTMLHQHVYKEHLEPATEKAKSWLDTWIESDIILDAPPEKREVEIFELQQRIGGPKSTDYESWIFSPSPWEPRAPARVAGQRVGGTRFFEDVRAPEGWEWETKKWALDLGAKEWVEERMIGEVEVEIEGERWVYDVDGSWRRRRWVRMVRRRVIGVRPSNGKKG
ncbi:MAG: hypothetical protein MMC33_000797 [Icmadophila ericetorum]|nr:hypothetical protein [Icmadophila ericetorum]